MGMRSKKTKKKTEKALRQRYKKKEISRGSIWWDRPWLFGVGNAASAANDFQVNLIWALVNGHHVFVFTMFLSGSFVANAGDNNSWSCSFPMWNGTNQLRARIVARLRLSLHFLRSFFLLLWLKIQKKHTAISYLSLDTRARLPFLLLLSTLRRRR